MTQGPTCYYDTWMYAVRHGGTIVHGTVIGGYPRRTIRHAWVEFDDGTVWDPQFCEVLSRDKYYELVEARPSRRYDMADATTRSFRTKRFGGPWEEE